MFRSRSVQIITLLTMTFVTLVSLSGQTIADDKAFQTNRGEYVYYLDRRTETPKLVGFMALGSNEYMVRSYDMISEEEVIVIYTIESKDSPNITKIGLVKGSLEDEEFNRQTLNFTNISALSAKTDLSSFPKPVAVIDPWEQFDFTLIHIFRFWVPLFFEYSVENEEDPDKNMTLLTVGIAESSEDPDFVNFTGLPGGKPGSKFQIEAGPEQPATWDGITLPLDTAWKLEGDKTAVIEGESGQDAVVMIESGNFGDFGDFKPYAFMKYQLLTSPGAVKGDSVKVSHYKQMPVLEYDYLDQNGIYRKVIKLFVDRGNNVYSIVTLSVQSSLYRLNSDYFRGILF